jgi:hypothetical protein
MIEIVLEMSFKELRGLPGKNEGRALQIMKARKIELRS